MDDKFYEDCLLLEQLLSKAESVTHSPKAEYSDADSTF